MTYKLATMIAVLLCWVAGTATAQQDPFDLGAHDSVIFVISEPTVGAVDQVVTAELYFWNDGQAISNVAFGFGWDNPNLQMESATWSQAAIDGFYSRLPYLRNDVDSTNANQKFQCVCIALFNPGLAASSERQLIVTYTFRASTWNASDFFCIDTEDFSTNTFVDFGNHEYAPYLENPFCVGNLPSGNLVLSPATLSFSGIVGQPNPAPQTMEVLSDQEPLAFLVNEDISWLLKSPVSGVTPQEIEFSVTTTGLAAGTYTESVEIVSDGAANSPQYLSVELFLAPPLPVIAVDHDDFYFNALAGGANPSDQVLGISNAGQSVLNWTVSNNESWLSLAPASGSQSGTVTLSVNTAGLTFGEYQDVITVTDPTAVNSPVEIPVYLAVASDLPVIEAVDPINYWTVDWDAEGPMFTRTFEVRNGGAGDLYFWVEKDDGFIINVTPASSSAPDEVTLLFYMPKPPDFTSEVPLTVLETVRILSNGAINSPYEVDCWFRFPLVPSVLSLSTASIEFDVYECSQGYGEPMPSQEFSVTNLGGDDPMTVEVTYESDFFVVEGVEPAQDAPATYLVRALRPDLAFGTYLDTIWVSSQWASNGPRAIEVTFNYLQTVETPVIALGAGTLNLPYQAESGPQIFNDLVIGNINPGCMTWQISESVPWLSAVAETGVVPDESPLLVDPVGYELGEYLGLLEIIAPDAVASSVTVGVNLQVWTLRGDVNWNGRISAQDVALLIDYVFEGEHPPQPAEMVADVNCDDAVDVADLALMIEYLFETVDPLCGNPY